MSNSFAPIKSPERLASSLENNNDSDSVIIDFESVTLALGFVKIGVDGYQEDGFVFKAAPDPVAFIGSDESNWNPVSGKEALNKLSALAVGDKPNQALVPSSFSSDVVVNYQELDDSGILEQEDFRFKGAYLSGFNNANALDQFEVTFTAYRDGEIVGEYTTMATSGTFVKSGIKGKMDTLIISDNSPDVDFWIDNAAFGS